MDRPKVTIITPTYNRGQLIDKTIESVLRQTYTNIEYIIIDGGSTDNTLNLLENYSKRSRLKYVSQKDEGMYYAVNKGIKLASGDIIAYLNSDDLYFPWTVEKIVQEFNQNNEIDMIYGDSLVDDLINGQVSINIYASHSKNWLPNGGVLCQPTVFLKRKIFERLGAFDINFKYLADCEFWCRVNKNNFNIKKIDELLAIECNHPGTLRETKVDLVSQEMKVIKGLYNKSGKIQYMYYKILNFINREKKLFKFAYICHLKKPRSEGAWANFLKTHRVRFDFVNYILCKIYHSKKTFPRFKINPIKIG